MKTAKRLLAALSLTGAIAVPACARELHTSARGDILDNPFVAYGFNPATQVLSGYLVALRTAPGRTDECKLVFLADHSHAKSLSIRYLGDATDRVKPRSGRRIAAVIREGGDVLLKFRKDALGGECDWILPFIGEPRVREGAEEVVVSLGDRSAGSWIGVYVIGSSRARFHGQPDDTSVQKAFLVKGDLIYVYDERKNWYFAEFDNGSRKTRGWIKKSDTVQM